MNDVDTQEAVKGLKNLAIELNKLYPGVFTYEETERWREKYKIKIDVKKFFSHELFLKGCAKQKIDNLTALRYLQQTDDINHSLNGIELSIYLFEYTSYYRSGGAWYVRVSSNKLGYNEDQSQLTVKSPGLQKRILEKLKTYLGTFVLNEVEQCESNRKANKYIHKLARMFNVTTDKVNRVRDNRLGEVELGEVRIRATDDASQFEIVDTGKLTKEQLDKILAIMGIYNQR